MRNSFDVLIMLINKIKTGFYQHEKVLKIITGRIYAIINILGSSLSKTRKIPLFVLRKVYLRLPANLRKRLAGYHLVKLVASKARTNARFFIKPDITPEQFILILNNRNISYVLLRWWEKFPAMPDDEDMDILVDDQDRKKIDDVLVRYPNENKCDIYTITGSEFGDYNGLPYFSNKLSRDLLSNRIIHNHLVYVPAKKIYFASLAYHVLFHKGADSGIPGFEQPDCLPEHNYKKLLEQLALELELGFDITAKDLFEWLRHEGYAPPEDLLVKLISIKPELKIFVDTEPGETADGEFMAFVVREKAIEEKLLDDILDILKIKFKLEILQITELSGSHQSEFSMNFRGGKWDKGPYPVSGGLPKFVIFCFDYYPTQPGHKDKLQFPAIKNSNIIKIKNDCRKLVFNTRFWYKHFNALHSADNESEAQHYLKAAERKSCDSIIKRINDIRVAINTSFHVHEVLSEGRRSKVELIDFHGIPAIKKTFRPGCERYCEREIYASETLSLKYDFIPKLLAKGKNYLITEYIDNSLKNMNTGFKRLIRKNYKCDIYKVIKCMYEERYELINFIPENIIIDKKGRLYVIDYEFLQPMNKSVKNINDTIMVKGISGDYSGDLPRGCYWHNSSFNSVWKEYTGSWESIKKEMMTNDICLVK